MMFSLARKLLQQLMSLENPFNKKENVPVVETVRVALLHRGKFLLLQKNASSKNPMAFEFPGGKIDEKEVDNSTIEEQIKSAIEETKQETGIDINGLPVEKIDEYKAVFNQNKDGQNKTIQRKVHLFMVRLPDEMDITPLVNQTKNEEGKPEDNHAGYEWVTKEELVLKLKIEENPVTHKRERPLSRNSRKLKKLIDKSE